MVKKMISLLFHQAKPDEITDTQVTTLLSPSIHPFISCLSCHHHAEDVFPTILRPSMSFISNLAVRQLHSRGPEQPAAGSPPRLGSSPEDQQAL